MTAFTVFVAMLTAAIHGLDLVFGWPFHGANIVYNAVAAVCSSMLMSMAINVYSELGR